MAYEYWSRIIPNGSVFLLAQGEYDDFNLIGLYRAGREIHLPDEVDAIGPGQPPEELAAHLVDSGAAERIDYDEIHLGAYGKLYPRVFCRHEKRTPTLFGHQDQETMIEVCDACSVMFRESERPATEEERKAFWASIPKGHVGISSPLPRKQNA